MDAPARMGAATTAPRPPPSLHLLLPPPGRRKCKGPVPKSLRQDRFLGALPHARARSAALVTCTPVPQCPREWKCFRCEDVVQVQVQVWATRAGPGLG